MAQMLKKLLSLALLTCVAMVQGSCGTGNCGTTNCGPNSIIIPRSQSVDAARELVGWQNLINRCDEDCWYGAFAFTAEYQQSFKGGQLAQCLFGPDVFTTGNCGVVSTSGVSGFSNNGFCCGDGNDRNRNECAALTISGSQTPNRGANDWLADYFGLPTDFKSVVTFCPRIQNAIFDFNFYFGLDNWAEGMFFRIHFPVVWAKWNLRATELLSTGTLLNGTTNGYLAGYMNSALSGTATATIPPLNIGITNANLQKSFLTATDGAHGTFGDVTQDFQYGIIGNGFSANNTTNTFGNCNGKNRCGGRTISRVSDVELALGWNFFCCDDYHLGLEIRGSAPAGNKPHGKFLFEPIVGNGHYGTLGGGLTSHYMFWRGCDDDRAFGLWLDVNVTHLFKSCQVRSFDFKNKPNSRYALLETLTSPAVALIGNTVAGAGSAGTGTVPSAQYVGTAGGLVHAINQTTFVVNSSFDVQADLVLKLGYQVCGWEFDLGYDLWARSCEKICPRGEIGLPASTYALKGDAFIYGYTAGGAAVPLSATESLSTIHAGTNTPVGTTYAANPQAYNVGVDFPQFAQTTGNAELYGPDGGTVQTRTSNPPVILSDSDIDYHGVPRALTNRVFGNINYTWTGCDDWMPFLGIGASGEFANGCGKNGSCGTGTVASCDNGSNGCAISQWAIWLKTGVAY